MPAGSLANCEYESCSRAPFNAIFHSWPDITSASIDITYISSPRLVTAITDQLKKMQDLYDKLANQLSEATVNPEGMDQFFVKNKSQHDSVENQFSWEYFLGVTDLGLFRGISAQKSSRALSVALSWMLVWMVWCSAQGSSLALSGSSHP